MKASNEPWVWLEVSVVRAVHGEQLAEHGGVPGLRDIGLLESAMARPQQLAANGEPDIAALAASHGFGLVENHPFADGNKRTAFVAVELFLMLNGGSLAAGDVDCVMAMLRLASGEWSEAAFAGWLREHNGPV